MVNAINNDTLKNSSINENGSMTTNSSNNNLNQHFSSSSTSSSSLPKPEKIEWPYDEKGLYKIALHFFKDNEGKAFHPSYDQRNTLMAYSLQEKYGQFNPEKAIPLGALDFVGHDRRNAWISLNSMSKNEARQHFVELLDRLCPFFRSYLIAVKFDLEEKERKRRELEESERIKQQEMEMLETRKAEEEEKQKKYEKQKSIIQEILNRQTINQFSTYARQQYPDSSELQEQLVKQLQEQHFQQYIQQMIEQSSGEFFVGNPDAIPSSGGISISDNDIHHQDSPHNNLTKNFNQLSLNTNHRNNNKEENCNNNINNNQDLSLQKADSYEDGDVDEESDEEGSAYSRHLNNASMWTRKDIVAFKDSVQAEGGHGIIKVGHGEIATIRVPTHDDGSCIFWEFATDYYDIGFGLFFEWNSSPDSQVSVYFSESEEDEEEEEQGDVSTTGHDIEKGTNRILSTKPLRTDESHSSISAIIPIYRRDSHEEVFAGSHIYPGKGVYLLKFDNSYSLWRSKTLYYRVYYTKEP